MLLKSSGINRNIVECKVNCVVSTLLFSASINRNIVECKDYQILNPLFDKQY